MGQGGGGRGGGVHGSGWRGGVTKHCHFMHTIYTALSYFLRWDIHSTVLLSEVGHCIHSTVLLSEVGHQKI